MVTKLRFWLIVLTLILVTILVMGGVWLKFLYTPLVTDKKGLKYTVKEGSSIRIVIDELHNQHVVHYPSFFKFLVRIKGVAHELKAGEYFFPQGTTPPMLLDQIITGTGMVYHSFTIVPGWSFKDVRSALLREENLNHTIQSLSNAEIMAKLGHPELKPEGEFFPDTYYFAAGSADIVILKRAFKAMREKLSAAWRRRDLKLPFKSEYEALIAASIIEKEAFLQEELPIIAGVLVNRLRKNMLLQFDPTVIYGAGPHFDGKIHKLDLLADNPYNTYVYKGLPPTPISMPSMKSIEAVLHPQKHNYYYFVASGKGAHKFSEHLEQHNQAVAVIKNSHPWFYNTNLIHYYLLKFFSQSDLSLQFRG